MTDTDTEITYPAVREQSRSTIAPAQLRPRRSADVDLGDRYWPPVAPFGGFEPEFREFLDASPERRREHLATLRSGDADAYGGFLHRSLAEIYAYHFGYRDSPVAGSTDDALEESLLGAKILLERELMDHWSTPEPVPDLTDQQDVADYLDEVARTNPGVGHPLFDYLRDEATLPQMMRFLQCETIRNEVVDDEVALLTVGLQGMQKAVAAANLWDECGRGKLDNFHTHWLRQLLEVTDGWRKMDEFRPHQPWYSKITSNTNAILLTRPGYKQMAFGCFLVFESWVEPHFRRILGGLDRLGVLDDDIRIYFAAHVAIDPRHSRELSQALRLQRPAPTPETLRQIMYGAHLAASGGARQFDLMLTYLRKLED